jgi:thiol-disulfide isomerase/thioredoxin
MFLNSDEPKILTESEIMELQNKHGIVLFYMDGCGHCEVMKPHWNKIIDELKEKHKDEIILGAIESSNMDMFKKSGISPSVSGFPTILYFHPNNITRHDVYNGDRSYEDLKKWILDKKDKKGKPSIVIIEKYNPDDNNMKKGMKGMNSMKAVNSVKSVNSVKGMNIKGLAQTGGGRRSRSRKSRRHMRKNISKKYRRSSMRKGSRRKYRR